MVNPYITTYKSIKDIWKKCIEERKQRSHISGKCERKSNNRSVCRSVKVHEENERGEGHVCLKPQTQKYFSTKWSSEKKERKKKTFLLTCINHPRIIYAETTALEYKVKFNL